MDLGLSSAMRHEPEFGIGCKPSFKSHLFQGRKQRALRLVTCRRLFAGRNATVRQRLKPHYADASGRRRLGRSTMAGPIIVMVKILFVIRIDVAKGGPR
ncbi:hypothetical protein, partial [Rhodoblastus sp.]|uniref:hypothetical protein n=1 Tax=Rhodoblastus sp. TaxID=1962975 RepID=UPI003F97EF1C